MQVLRVILKYYLIFDAESSGTEETVGTEGNLELDDPLPEKVKERKNQSTCIPYKHVCNYHFPAILWPQSLPHLVCDQPSCPPSQKSLASHIICKNHPIIRTYLVQRGAH